MLKTLGNVWCAFWMIICIWIFVSWFQLAFEIDMGNLEYNFFTFLAKFFELIH